MDEVIMLISNVWTYREGRASVSGIFEKSSTGGKPETVTYAEFTSSYVT